MTPSPSVIRAIARALAAGATARAAGDAVTISGGGTTIHTDKGALEAAQAVLGHRASQGDTA